MREKKPRLLVIQHSPAEDLGTFGAVLSERGGEATYVRVYAGEDVPTTVRDFHGLVLMGGPMGVYERDRYPFLGAELELVQWALQQGTAVLGVCLGSQLLAHALGAKVGPGTAKEIGWYDVRLTEKGHSDPLLTQFPEAFVGFHWHGDVFPLPPGAVALASSDLTPVQAFRYGEKAYGLLFHLEMTEEIAAKMIRDFEEELREAGIPGEAVLGDFSTHGETLVQLGRSFFGGWLSLL